MAKLRLFKSVIRMVPVAKQKFHFTKNIFWEDLVQISHNWIKIWVCTISQITESISSMFLCARFSSKILAPKYRQKRARKMLKQLTPVVNFINIKRTNVHFCSFYYVHVARKSCQNNVRSKNARVLRWWNWRLFALQSFKNY